MHCLTDLDTGEEEGKCLAQGNVAGGVPGRGGPSSPGGVWVKTLCPQCPVSGIFDVTLLDKCILLLERTVELREGEV